MFEKFKKIMWYDTETTGLDPIINDIIQLSYILEIDGKIIIERDLKMKPVRPYICTGKKTHFIRYKDSKNYKEGDECPECKNINAAYPTYKIGTLKPNYSEKALEVIGKTFEELMAYPDPHIVLNQLKEDVKPHIKNGNRFLTAGYNIKTFDNPMLAEWLSKLAYKYPAFWNFFYYSPYIDVLPLTIAEYYKLYKKGIELPEMANFKLASACDLTDYLNPKAKMKEEDNYHDALFDVKMTRHIFHNLILSDTTKI